MLTKTMDVREAQSRLWELLPQVLAGMELVLTDKNTPIARLVPILPRVPGLHAGATWTSADFDEPLSEDLWTDSV